MPVLKVESEFGHSCPPESPNSLTTNMAGWETAVRIREGDGSVLSRLVHLYPRFMPRSHAAELMNALHVRLALPDTHDLLAFLHPCSLLLARRNATNPARKEKKIPKEELFLLDYRVVDVDGTRLFVVTYPKAKSSAVMGTWKSPGIGISIRLAESLLPHVSSLTEFAWDRDPENPPGGSFVPETPDHAALRERISDLLSMGVPVERKPALPAPHDVYLYPSGMAAIFYMHLALAVPGRTAVLLGSLFHNTYHYLPELGSCKHFGRVDSQGIDELEAWMDKERSEGRGISYLLIEFPSNPLLASADLFRLKQLAHEHHALLVIDETVASFCNVDVSPVADVTVTSLTKSFNGHANVMAGCVTLYPSSPFYATITKPTLSGQFHNELFAGDAATLLANSRDYLVRSAVLNRNAHAMAALLHNAVQDPHSPVARVLYPPFRPDGANYRALLRAPTPEFSANDVGYGCLLSVDFESVAMARAFYDHLGGSFYPGPHLGAHKTLAFAYNALVFGKPFEVDYHRTYGILLESVRISAGLEDTEDLLDSLREALRVAARAKAAAEKPTE